jgi:hypothetical protein
MPEIIENDQEGAGSGLTQPGGNLFRLKRTRRCHATECVACKPAQWPLRACLIGDCRADINANGMTWEVCIEFCR